ncbi:hypothetical protein AURDEDRAFT_118533 [Auricularia subglabra TFB-10046 SS5]|nr:hypothetical protein AURDEDRAFT_118533 [Auricularia subglabra TFB-10046 SS5]
MQLNMKFALLALLAVSAALIPADETPANNGAVSDAPETTSTASANNGLPSCLPSAIWHTDVQPPRDEAQRVKSKCTYQRSTGVLNADRDRGQCRHGAVPIVAGCTPGAANNGGVVKTRAQ